MQESIYITLDFVLCCNTRNILIWRSSSL